MRKGKSGFTLIELITVITIIGVLAVVVGPRFASSDVYEQRTFYDDVLKAVRYAQAKASGSGCITQVDFTATGFSISVDADCNSGSGFSAADLVNPSTFESVYTQAAALPSGVTYSSSVDPLLFDAKGRAMDSALNIIGSAAQINIGARTINVEGATGYVH
ncbi:MAG: hypothetical protein CMK89_06570 [Pseudomonadales bacterium]|nr:hypothetical protein [Pseudomonadales bacterium]